MLTTVNRYFLVPWFIFLTVLTGVLGYYRVFSGFSEWDDEGSLMMSVQQFMQGHRLYAEIPTAYGPIYYFYNYAVRTLSGTLITHDSTRFGAILPLLVAPLICAWYILQLTRSLAVASLVHICTAFLMLRFIVREPGHPQEICILLVVCFIAAGQLTSNGRWHTFGVFLLGAIAAALSLVKVNIGGFVTIGGALAFLFHLPRTKLTRLALLVTTFAAISLPLVLMNNHLDDRSAKALCIVITVSIVALLLRLGSSSRSPAVSCRDCVLAAAGYIGVFGAVLLSLSLRGIGLSTLLDSLVLGNVRLFVTSRAFYVPPELGRAWPILALAGPVAALMLFRIERGRSPGVGNASPLVSVIKFAWGAAALGISFVGTPLRFIPPFSWLAITSPPDEAQSVQSFPRTLLCAVGVLQALYVYPVAGSQNEFVGIPLILIAALCVGDIVLAAPFSPRLWRKYLPLATAVILVSVPVKYAIAISRSRQRYDSLPSLALRGAQRVHLDARQARQYQWLTSNIRSYCDVIFGLPNIPSLHFWTERDPVTTLTWDDWFLFATPEQQRTIQAKLSEHKNACVVSNPDLVNFWNRTGKLDVNTLPLVQYIHAEFKPVLEIDNYHLLVRKDRLREDWSLQDVSTGSGKKM